MKSDIHNSFVNIYIILVRLTMKSIDYISISFNIFDDSVVTPKSIIFYIKLRSS